MRWPVIQTYTPTKFVPDWSTLAGVGVTVNGLGRQVMLAKKISTPGSTVDKANLPIGAAIECTAATVKRRGRPKKFNVNSELIIRLLPGDGCEYGTDWIIRAILRDELTPVDAESAFEDSIRECYPETVTVGWMNLDSVSVMKEMDPVSWDIAKSEWESQEAEEGNIFSFVVATT